MPLLTYGYRLYPSKAQYQALDDMLYAYRDLYNAAINILHRALSGPGLGLEASTWAVGPCVASEAAA